jgi:hypothetical protein
MAVKYTNPCKNSLLKELVIQSKFCINLLKKVKQI